MKKDRIKKVVSILLIAFSLTSIGINAYAHSGRTDSSGGHRDNQNKSGLGSYHYHCGGHPAHLHTNGVCPYSSASSGASSTSSSSSGTSSTSSSSSSSSSNKSTTSSSSSQSTKTTSTVPTTVVATDIKINENITEMEVEEIQQLTATLIPDNVTDKNITWKSSDESIATISSSGEITAKKSGTVEITATSSNGKTNTIKINIKEEQKAEQDTEPDIEQDAELDAKQETENTAIMNTTTTSANNINNNVTTATNKENSNPFGGILTLGLLGGGGYWGYKKYKKS